MKKLSLRVFKIRGPDWDTREKIKYSFFFLRLLGIISLLSATMILAEPWWKHSPCRLEWSSILESGGGLDGSLWEIRDTVPANIKLGHWHRSCRAEQTTTRAQSPWKNFLCFKSTSRDGSGRMKAAGCPGASGSIRPLKIAMFCNPGLHFPVAHGASRAPPSCSDDKEEDTLVENHKGIACTPSSLCVPVTCLHLIWFDVLKPSRERGNLNRQKVSGSLGR